MSNNAVALGSCTTGAVLCVGQYFASIFRLLEVSEWVLVLGCISTLIGIATGVSAFLVNIKRYKYHSNRLDILNRRNPDDQ